MEFTPLSKSRPAGFIYGDDRYLDPDTGVTYVDLNVVNIDPQPEDDEKTVYLSDPWIVAHEKPSGVMQLARSRPLEIRAKRGNRPVSKLVVAVQALVIALLIYRAFHANFDFTKAFETVAGIFHAGSPKLP